MNGYAKLEVEKVHLRQCRWTLGVHNRSTIDAVMGELGRYPLYIDIASNMFKYMHYIECHDKGSLIYEALVCNSNLAESGIYSWLSCINYIKQELNLCTDVNSITRAALGRRVKTKLINRYMEKWFQSVHSQNPHSKLRTYKLFKRNHGREQYLKIMNCNHRRSLAKLRTSTHSLEIEMGRRRNIPSENRLCRQCNLGKVEDELHLVVECPLYEDERKALYDVVEKACPTHFVSHNHEQKFLYIMSSEDSLVYNALAKFVYSAMSKRNPKE